MTIAPPSYEQIAVKLIADALVHEPGCGCPSCCVVEDGPQFTAPGHVETKLLTRWGLMMWEAREFGRGE